MIFHHDISGCMESAIGEHGLAPVVLDRWLTRLAPAFSALQDAARTGAMPHFAIPGETADIAMADSALKAMCAGGEVLFVLGTGGSSLGGQTLARFGGWSIPGDRGGNGHTSRLRLRFYDNLDARSFMKGLRLERLEASRFLVISKSGGTAETLAQMLTVLTLLREAGLEARAPSMFLAVSDPRRPGSSNGLRDLCEAYGIPVLDHPPGIGGRYSGLSIVGLLPLMARGLDPLAVRRGARRVIEALIAARAPAENDAAVGAAVHIALAKEKGIRAAVMMPYCDQLERFAAWYVQLWAESLGKRGEGTIPVAALGPVDQHSQLQLYLDGPHEHFVTVLRVRSEHASPAIPGELAALARAPYLAGRSITALVEAQSLAIADTFAAAQRPLRAIDIPRLDEAAMGALMMHFMIETILAAALLGVDPFDQPAVEMGKRITQDYLARSRPQEESHAHPPVAADGH